MNKALIMYIFQNINLQKLKKNLLTIREQLQNLDCLFEKVKIQTLFGVM